MIMDTSVNAPALTRRGFLIAAAGTGVAFSFLTACQTDDTSTLSDIYNISGIKVRSNVSSTDISNLAPGIYIIKKQNDKTVTKKIVIK